MTTGPARGRLRVYLGAAPGVGKTFRMLEEGRRRLERGTDVVVGLVETHGRPRTAALIEGFEVIPRRPVEYRGTTLLEFDLDALLARSPDVALIDEFAHTNAPGSRHDKRWEDIESVLDAGIDVITTLNVQHLESLTDALTQITGVVQRETVPDEIVRRADQIELVDMAPEALRRRISHGNVYGTERIDAALGQYFRVGNLTALRELALLWVADRVDDQLLEYRQGHGISEQWETRERIVVALTGAPSGEALIRRAARIAERSRAELLGVHVRRADGLGDLATDDGMSRHRQLLTDLGGRYHELVGDDPAAQLVAFARSENATQLVLGTTRRRRIDELVHGSVINRAVRSSPDIDVHVVALELDPAEHEHRRRRGSIRRWTAAPLGVSPRRNATAIVLALIGPAMLTAAFLPFRNDIGLPGVLPAFMLLVVLTALLGGTVPALIAAGAAFVLGNVAFTEPYGTLRITAPSSVIGLTSFIAVATVVALVVGRLARRTTEVDRARSQARALASASASLADDDAVPGLLDRLRTLMALDVVGIVDADGTFVHRSGEGTRVEERFEPSGDGTQVDLPGRRRLVLSPPVATAEEWMIVRAFGDQLAAAMRRNELAATELRAGALAEIDQFRTALLRSVSHDLRTPLASIKAAGSSLLQDDVEWPAEAVSEFLATIVEEADRLDRIVSNLLDATRLEAGVLAVSFRTVHLDELVGHLVSSIPSDGRIRIEIDPSTPPVVADPGLLERVLENLVRNALRHAPGPIVVASRADLPAGVVRLEVIDHGPGVAAEHRDAMFDPFQRLDDRTVGIGLGLAVARGFVEAMGGAIEPAETPGGGLTVSIVLATADDTTEGEHGT